MNVKWTKKTKKTSVLMEYAQIGLIQMVSMNVIVLRIISQLEILLL